MPAGKQRVEILVGAFVLVGLVVLGWLLLRAGGFEKRSGRGYGIVVLATDVSGIRVGAPVRMGGLEIGHVAVEPDFGENFREIEVGLVIHEHRKIPKGSEFQIATSGLMGDAYVRVVPASTGGDAYLEPGSRVETTGVKTLNDLVTGAVGTLEETGGALAELGEAVATMNRLLAKVDGEVFTEENLEGLGEMFANVTDAMERIEEISRRLEPALEEVSGAAVKLQGAADTANVAFGDISGGVGEFTETLETIDPALEDFDAALGDLQATLRAADSLFTRIEHGGGLSDALINDPKLRADLTSFVEKLNRNGVLFYPRSGRPDGDGQAAPSSRAAPKLAPRGSAAARPSSVSAPGGEKKKGLFPWLKRKQ